MQQNCAVHSRGVYWPALHDPHCPHKGQEQHRAHRTDRRQTVRRSWRRWYSCIRFFTNSIRFSVSYMPSNLLPKKQSKKVFHLYRYKKTEKLSPENQIFLKKFESCRNSSQKRKIRLYYCIESPSDSQNSGYLNLFFRFTEIKVTTIFHSHVYLIQYAFG